MYIDGSGGMFPEYGIDRLKTGAAGDEHAAPTGKPDVTTEAENGGAATEQQARKARNWLIGARKLGICRIEMPGKNSVLPLPGSRGGLVGHVRQCHAGVATGPCILIEAAPTDALALGEATPNLKHHKTAG